MGKTIAKKTTEALKYSSDISLEGDTLQTNRNSLSDPLASVFPSSEDNQWEKTLKKKQRQLLNIDAPV